MSEREGANTRGQGTHLHMSSTDDDVEEDVAPPSEDADVNIDGTEGGAVGEMPAS